MTAPRTGALRAAGAVLWLSFLVPIETLHDGPRFLWQLAPDLGGMSTAVLVAPACAGALVVAATFVWQRAAAVAVVALGALVGLQAVTSAGAQALAQDLLPAPEIWSRTPAPALLAVALAAAGVSLSSRPLLVAALPCTVAHLLVPSAGEAPLGMLARVIGHVATSSGSGNLVSAGLLALIVLWPAMAVVAGWLLARRAQPRRLGALLSASALPTALVPVVERSLANPWSGASGLPSTLGGMTVLVALLVILAVSIASLASRPLPELRRERTTAIVSLGAATVIALAASRLAAPTARAPAFRLGPATTSGDRLFGDLLPRWSALRARVDRGAATAGPELAVAEEALRGAARDSRRRPRVGRGSARGRGRAARADGAPLVPPRRAGERG